MTRRVGFLDSGLGGLTVLAALRELLGGVDVIYFADTAHVPYGDRSLESVADLGRRIVERLLEHRPAAIIVASGTTCAAFDACGRPDSPVPLIGVVEFGARAAVEATRNGKIGVIATQATVESGIFERAIRKLRAEAHVTSVPAPALVPLVEAGDWESEIAKAAVAAVCAPVVTAGCDVAVLGCTHYPHLLTWFSDALGPNVAIVDPGTSCAEEVARRLSALAASSGRTIVEVSGDSDVFAANAFRLNELVIDELPQIYLS